MKSHSHSFLLLAGVWSSAVLLAAAIPAQSACELQKALASDGLPASEFGEAMSVSANQAAVASWRHAAKGIDSGAVYAFEKLGASWVETGVLVPSDGAAGDRFGTACSISGDTIVGASAFDDDNGFNSGSAYVFEKVSGVWTETAKLLPDDGAAKDWFGFFCGVSGNHAVVTANRDDDLGTDSGSAYIFEKIGAAWVQTAKLLASDGAAGDEFGYSCSISGTTAVITAPYDTDGEVDAGSAYVFENVSGSWVETAKLVPSTGASQDRFGWSVSVDGDTVVVGAAFDDDKGTDSGSAYVFEKIGGAWVETAKLLAADGAARDELGGGVSVSGTKILLAARNDDDNGFNSGSAYLFEQLGGNWVQTAKLLPRDGAAGDEFGFQGAIGGDVALVGARHDDDLGGNSGSVYFFSVSATGCPTLVADRITVSLATGGTQNLSLAAGPALAGHSYVLFGSASGTWPGFSLAGWSFPLNIDGYLMATLSNPTLPPLVNGLATLSGSGTASAGFRLPPGLPAALIGFEFHHAFATVHAANITSVSNPVNVRIVP